MPDDRVLTPARPHRRLDRLFTVVRDDVLHEQFDGVLTGSHAVAEQAEEVGAVVTLSGHLVGQALRHRRWASGLDQSPLHWTAARWGPPSARARVVGSHINGDFAAVYVLADEGADWLSVAQRDEGGWNEVAGRDGGPMWVDTDDDADDRGVLACAIPVDAPGDYLVRYADSSATIRAAEPYVADDRPRVTRLGG